MRMLIAASFKGTVVPGCNGGARPARRWPPIMIRPQAAADKRDDNWQSEPFFLWRRLLSCRHTVGGAMQRKRQ
jgi:hypothetical protein